LVDLENLGNLLSNYQGSRELPPIPLRSVDEFGLKNFFAFCNRIFFIHYRGFDCSLKMFLYSNVDNVSFMWNNLCYSHELMPLATGVFLFGIVGFVESREFLSVLINTEIMMLGVNFHLITSAVLWAYYYGQVYALCFLAITAA
jgi:NADH:ubiquinone oxidoreductase subunit K